MKDETYYFEDALADLRDNLSHIDLSNAEDRKCVKIDLTIMNDSYRVISDKERLAHDANHGLSYDRNMLNKELQQSAKTLKDDKAHLEYYRDTYKKGSRSLRQLSKQVDSLKADDVAEPNQSGYYEALDSLLSDPLISGSDKDIEQDGDISFYDPYKTPLAPNGMSSASSETNDAHPSASASDVSSKNASDRDPFDDGGITR